MDLALNRPEEKLPKRLDATYEAGEYFRQTFLVKGRQEKSFVGDLSGGGSEMEWKPKRQAFTLVFLVINKIVWRKERGAEGESLKVESSSKLSLTSCPVDFPFDLT
jgi:hypothetical protein